MTVVGAVVGAAAVILVGALSSLVAAEAHSYGPQLARWVVRRAAAWLPEAERREFRDELYDHIHEYRRDGKNLTCAATALSEWCQAVRRGGLVAWASKEASERRLSVAFAGLFAGAVTGLGIGLSSGLAYGLEVGLISLGAGGVGSALGAANFVVRGDVRRHGVATWVATSLVGGLGVFVDVVVLVPMGISTFDKLTHGAAGGVSLGVLAGVMFSVTFGASVLAGLAGGPRAAAFLIARWRIAPG